MTAKASAVKTLKPGQRVRILWEVVKTTPCPACGKIGLRPRREEEEKRGALPVCGAITCAYNGEVLEPKCGCLTVQDGFLAEGDDGETHFYVPEWLEAF